ncbi:hypothetical protein BV898_08685 [Hypsibius exemplaris]|uniref:Uncharacterized protein n=1 Tax=Hypsibius exemplaris TaxID=2072580 RepID=A0A1W0WQ61_HYPEX|nr:hypothetical protein BV898_08685 [Hypsibius exemplaris]
MRWPKLGVLQSRPSALTIIVSAVLLNLCVLLVLFQMRQSFQTTVDLRARIFAKVCDNLAAVEEDPVVGNTKEKALAQPEVKEPFYCHYVRFRPDGAANITLRFIDYLSVMSAVQRLKPDGIFLHGDEEPVGHYWEDMKRRGWIKFLIRAKVFELQGRTTEFASKFHMADMIKLDILIEYGGVAVDFDVYFVRGERIKTILSEYAALTCYGDHIGYNIGFIGFRKDSRLLHAWRRSYDVIYVEDWNFNSGDVQKYLSEIFSEETYVVDRSVCALSSFSSLQRLPNVEDLAMAKLEARRLTQQTGQTHEATMLGQHGNRFDAYRGKTNMVATSKADHGDHLL